MSRYLRRKAKAKSDRGRYLANVRWSQDRERRLRLAEMEEERKRRLVVILRDNDTGEERVFPYSDQFPYLVRAAAQTEF
jgi:hypothetical protein